MSNGAGWSSTSGRDWQSRSPETSKDSRHHGQTDLGRAVEASYSDLGHTLAAVVPLGRTNLGHPLAGPNRAYHDCHQILTFSFLKLFKIIYHIKKIIYYYHSY